jgi:hypothetical protein
MPALPAPQALYMPRLIEHFGQQMPAIDLRKQLRCSNCLDASANLHESKR